LVKKADSQGLRKTHGFIKNLISKWNIL